MQFIPMKDPLRRGIPIPQRDVSGSHEAHPGPNNSFMLGQAALSSGRTVSAWTSHEWTDGIWDRFLQGTRLGQYQQTSFWAKFKAVDGWRVTRVILTAGDEIIGGFQALTRSSRKGKIGYITKGPVLLPAYSDASGHMAQLVRDFAKRERLLALVVQPPDFSEGEIPFPEDEFPLFVLDNIVDATWLLDLSGGYEAVAQGFNKTARTQLRRAVKNGFTSREGNRDDLKTFFDLMQGSCQHQGVKPNPATVEHLYALWDAAQAGGHIRLCLIEHAGAPVVAELCLGFGTTWSLWRTGRIPSAAQNNPTEFSVDHALRNACASGQYSICDFGSFDRTIAAQILRDEPWDRKQLDGRHVFHIRFGGFPRILPQARVYIPNPIARFAYRTYLSLRPGLRIGKEGMTEAVSEAASRR